MKFWSNHKDSIWQKSWVYLCFSILGIQKCQRCSKIQIECLCITHKMYHSLRFFACSAYLSTFVLVKIPAEAKSNTMLWVCIVYFLERKHCQRDKKVRPRRRGESIKGTWLKAVTESNRSLNSESQYAVDNSLSQCWGARELGHLYSNSHLLFSWGLLQQHFNFPGRESRL